METSRRLDSLSSYVSDHKFSNTSFKSAIVDEIYSISRRVAKHESVKLHSAQLKDGKHLELHMKVREALNGTLLPSEFVVEFHAHTEVLEFKGEKDLGEALKLLAKLQSALS